MTVVTIAVVGITAVLLAVALKGMKGEYGTYLVMAAGFFIFFYGVGKLTTRKSQNRLSKGFISGSTASICPP